jgi:hypothetical protein
MDKQPVSHAAFTILTPVKPEAKLELVQMDKIDPRTMGR